MGTIDRGIYLPVIEETGWGEEVSDNFSRLADIAVNVKASGYDAVGDGLTVDTAAFVAAATAALLEDSPLYVPDGTYIVDGDAIEAALTTVNRFYIYGSGNATIKAASGASCAFAVNDMARCEVANITFDGNSKASDGFRQYGNGRSNLFRNCRFQNAINGFQALPDADTPAQDQNERNVFLNCNADDNTTGYRITSGNVQGQLFIGGGGATNTTGFYASAGWADFHAAFFTTGTTAWKTDSGFQKLALYGCLDEGLVTSVDLGVGNLIAHNSFFQGSTANITAGSATAFIDATFCTFTDGTFTVGNSSVYHDRHNTYAVGFDGFSPGTNAFRHKWDGTGYSVFSQAHSADWTAHSFHQNPLGWQEFRVVSDPASPAANYRRIFFDGLSGITSKDSSGNLRPMELPADPNDYTQTYSTADRTHAAPTAATLTVTDGAGTNDNTIGAITADASVIAAVQELADEINKLVADVADTKQLINAVIDDLQTAGIVD